MSDASEANEAKLEASDEDWEGETYSWRRRLILVVKMASATLYEGL